MDLMPFTQPATKTWPQALFSQTSDQSHRSTDQSWPEASRIAG
jgi:hypothetical protein